jgi:GNAT superfamily N-acetyltransferase
MIRFARKADQASIKALWLACFDDPPEVVDAYFSFRHRNEYMPVWADGHAIVGMLTMLPIELRAGGQSYPGRYIFAVATHPAYRGRGISTQLLTFAHNWMRARGERAATLVPADEGLFDFYHRRGYETYFYQRRLTLRPGDMPPPPAGARIERCDAEEWLAIRDRAFEGSPFVRWDVRALRYMIQSQQLDGGGVARITAPGGEAIVAWDQSGGEVVVRELALRGLEVKPTVAALHASLGAGSYRLMLPAGGGALGGEEARYGMLNWLDGEPPEACGAPYLSLAKD